MASKRLYGGETAKAVSNFPISGEPVPVEVVHWLGRIKGAAARANGELGLLDKKLASAIAKAADEVASGAHDRQFPIDVFQTGSGTSSNMNANEVIGTLSGAHPNDHVNMGQSSNDVFPSAVHLAALDVAVNQTLPGARAAREVLRAQGDGVQERRQVRPHAPHGRRARDARPGVRRLRGADPARPGADRVRARARRPDPARRHRDRHRPQRAPQARREGAPHAQAPRRSSSRSPRRWTASRRRPTATRSSSCPARSRSSRSRCRRSPATWR